MAIFFAPSSQALTLHVATNGNDSWSGTLTRPSTDGKDGPLASLAGARDAIRKYRITHPLPEPVNILVGNGTYSLQSPLTLTAQDSGTLLFPVTYKAESGAQPVFSGGRVVSGWQSGADGIWWTDIPAVKQGSWYFEQLWVNGRRAVRARAFNTSVPYVTAVREQMKWFVTGPSEQYISVRPADLQLLNGLSGQELRDVSFVAMHRWDVTRRFVDSVDVRGGVIGISGAPMESWNPITTGTPYFLENFRAALDAPGEWFLSRTGRLYYKPLPGEDMSSAQVVAPATSKFLILSGNASNGSYVQNLVFDGLSFQYTQWLTTTDGVGPSQAASLTDASIMVQGARNIQFSNCEISHTGGTYGIWFTQGTRAATLSHCYLHDLGAGGVRIGEGYAATSDSGITRQVIVDNNIIRRGGRFVPDAVGVWIGQSSDNQITHNEIADFFYTGVSVGWTWGYGSSIAVRNQISYNHIHHLGWRMLSELGGIYTLGVSTGTTVNNNLLHDIYAYDYGAWALYLDAGSSNLNFTNNLVYNAMSAGFHLNYGQSNDVRNNIFVYSQAVQLQRTTTGQNALNLVNNIVYWKDGELFAGPWDASDVTLARNLYFDASGKPIHFTSMDFAAWQKSGRDVGSKVADPLFVAPASNDFHLQWNSPAFMMGFVPFDYSLAGVYGDTSWTSLATSEQYPPVEIPPAQPSLSHMQ